MKDDFRKGIIKNLWISKNRAKIIMLSWARPKFIGEFWEPNFFTECNNNVLKFNTDTTNMIPIGGSGRCYITRHMNHIRMPIMVFDRGSIYLGLPETFFGHKLDKGKYFVYYDEGRY